MPPGTLVVCISSINVELWASVTLSAYETGVRILHREFSHVFGMLRAYVHAEGGNNFGHIHAYEFVDERWDLFLAEKTMT